MPVLVRKLSQVGNSKGLILPQTVLEMLDWGSDTEVELRITGKKLILSARDRYATDEDVMKAADTVFKRRRKLMEKLSQS